MEPFTTSAETMWELRVVLLSQALKEGKHSFASAEESTIVLLTMSLSVSTQTSKGLFGSAEALVYLIQKELSFSSLIMFRC